MKCDAKQQLYRGMDQLGLPSDVLGGSHISLQGDRQVLVSGQKGIRSYETHEILVELSSCALRIFGRELGLVTMTGSEVLIRGHIDGLEFVR